MENIRTRSILTTIFLLFPIFALAQENRGLNLHSKRLALVIGNNAYQTVPLKNPVNDAEDMSSTLKKKGFTVILKKNADQRTMEDTIRYFGRQLRGSGVGLFYFAGHGMQIDGRNYLIPIDAKIESESDVKYEGLDAGRVLGKMEDAENPINIVILDACRNNPFSRNFRTSERGLARMDAPKGSVIAYATAPGDIAADGHERNGIFTKYLMKHMTVPDLPIELVLKQARIDVARATGGRQIPWESSSLMGDFYFYQKIDKRLAPERKGVEREEKNTISKQTTTHASLDPAVVDDRVLERDGRYEKYTNGVVYDTKTGLAWYAGPDKDISGDRARLWVARLKEAGGGWRMPTRKELKSLYQKSGGKRNMTPLLKTTGWDVWSGGIPSGSNEMWYFSFYSGRSFTGMSAQTFHRCFAVRSRK